MATEVIIFKAFEASQLSTAWLDMAICSAVTKNVCFLLHSTPRKPQIFALKSFNETIVLDSQIYI